MCEDGVQTSDVAALRDRLLPLVDLVTPNLPEAADLLGVAEASSLDSMAEQASELAKLGPAVLLKGGHLGGSSSPDLFLASASASLVTPSAPRVASTNDHGTGCTLSAAVAALQPQRSSVEEAIRDAKDYLSAALSASARLEVGNGHGPVRHFHQWW